MVSSISNQAKSKSAEALIAELLSAKKTDGSWDFSPKVKIAFAELEAIMSDESRITEEDLMALLQETRKPISSAELKKLYRQKVRTKEGETKQCDWQFLIPVGIMLNPGLAEGPLPLLGSLFHFINVEQASKLLDENTAKEINDPKAIWLRTGVQADEAPSTYLYVSAKAGDRDKAWNKIGPAFDALRGIIELALGCGRWRYLFPQKKLARGKFPHPLWMISFGQGGAPEWLTFITDAEARRPTKSVELTADLLEKIKHTAHLLKQPPAEESTLALIADCLRLYSQAMDAGFNHLCLLGLWQLAEAITLSKEFRGKTKEVARRLSLHSAKIDLAGSGYRYCLEAIGRKRNDVVHRGIHRVKDDDINILKLACEIALQWLVDMYEKMPTQDCLSRYYREEVTE